MTEDEAKTKWCPFVQFSVGQVSDKPLWLSNRNDPDTTKVTCIASACMAWRYSDKGFVDKADWQGYCGLTTGVLI